MNAKEPEALPLLVQITAQTHISMLQAALPGLLAAYYAVGSAALGDFHAGKSDVDFVALLSHMPTAGETEALKALHRQLVDKRLLAGLDGFYISQEDFRAPLASGCLRFNEGRYQGLKPFHISAPDGWVLKQYGVCLHGQSADSLPFEVDWSKLRQGMLENLDAYWQKWASGCRKHPMMALALYCRLKTVEWGVLGISRLYFSLRKQDVASKTGAGEYALAVLPERWHTILHEALRIRSGSKDSFYKSVIKRRKDALEYVEFMIRECKTLTPRP